MYVDDAVIWPQCLAAQDSGLVPSINNSDRMMLTNQNQGSSQSFAATPPLQGVENSQIHASLSQIPTSPHPVSQSQLRDASPSGEIEQGLYGNNRN
jgi:hypothetical protein